MIRTVVSAGACASDSRLGRSGEPDIPAPVDIADTNGIICLGVGWFHNIIVYENGSAVILKNNVPRYLIVEFSQAEQMQAAEDEDIMQISARLIQQNRAAYEELAK